MIKLPPLITTLCAGLLLVACSKPTVEVVNQPVVEEKEPVFQTYSAEEFFKTTSVFGSSINADSSAVLVSSDKSGIFNAYKVPLDGSAPVRLTHSTLESVFVVSWFPKDDRLLYSADKGGDELDHLYVRELSGEIRDLTPGESLKA